MQRKSPTTLIAFLGIRLFVSIFFLHLPGFVSAQLVGRVLSYEDNKPIAGASIYINNTSIGTTSSATGDFYLQVSEIQNKELIVSYVGYEPIRYELSGPDLAGKRLVFKLAEKEQEMEAVLVMTDPERRRLLQIFKINFVGQTREAERTSIENIKDIYFLPGKDGPKSIIAKADAPIRLKNRMLGYDISFDLIEFAYDPVGGTTSFFGYTRYESFSDKNKYIKNRANAYEGSTQHFFKSVLANKLEEEKFSMLGLKEMKAADGQKMDIGYPLTKAQVLTRDSADTTTFILKVEERLQVKYLKATPGSRYLQGKFPFARGISKSMVQSTLHFTGPLYISADAVIINPLDLQVAEYWSFEKLANLLPQDYKPGD